MSIAKRAMRGVVDAAALYLYITEATMKIIFDPEIGQKPVDEIVRGFVTDVARFFHRPEVIAQVRQALVYDIAFESYGHKSLDFNVCFTAAVERVDSMMKEENVLREFLHLTDEFVVFVREDILEIQQAIEAKELEPEKKMEYVLDAVKRIVNKISAQLH